MLNQADERPGLNTPEELPIEISRESPEHVIKGHAMERTEGLEESEAMG